jgi:hypothetical protein
MHDIQTGIFLKATVQMTEIKLSTDIFGSELNGKFGSAVADGSVGNL